MPLTMVVGLEINNRYVLQSHIGSGGFGSVWRAADKQLNRDVALKRLLKPGGMTPSEITEQLLKEARKHAQLVHTNIVQVYDVIECEEEHLIVMEYVDGPSLRNCLRDYSKKGQLFPLDKAISILRDVLSGVSFAHDKSVVHRDLSPSNILLTSTGIPKISDFGIAIVLKTGDDVENITSHGGTGNPQFMSPEQHRGEQADALSDLFMVGIIGYILLTGKHPFAHSSGLFEIPELINDDNYIPESPKPSPSLDSSQQKLFREYSAIVMRLLIRERAGRFPTARLAIEALESVTPYQECPQCGERLPEHFRWCGYCGSKIEQPTDIGKAKVTMIPVMGISSDQLVEEGFALSQMRNWDDAIKRYQQAIEIDPKNQKAYRNLGYVLNRIGRFEEAEDILSKGLEIVSIAPSHEASLLHERALARAELKKYSEALEDINHALSDLPYSIKSIYLRAKIYLYRGSVTEARRDAQEVLRNIPDHVGAIRLLDQIS